MYSAEEHGRHAARVAVAVDPDLFDAVTVRPLGGERFDITVRGHTVTVDQPAPGGDDTAPTPTELFVASLAGCVAFYAQRFLVRHDLPVEGLAVRAHWTMAVRPARVASIAVQIQLPPGIPPERRDALLAVASRCTVHNTLLEPPQVDLELRPAEVAV
jgi:putative redox protein